MWAFWIIPNIKLKWCGRYWKVLPRSSFKETWAAQQWEVQSADRLSYFRLCQLQRAASCSHTLPGATTSCGCGCVKQGPKGPTLDNIPGLPPGWLRLCLAHITLCRLPFPKSNFISLHRYWSLINTLHPKLQLGMYLKNPACDCCSQEMDYSSPGW